MNDYLQYRITKNQSQWDGKISPEASAAYTQASWYVKIASLWALLVLLLTICLSFSLGLAALTMGAVIVWPAVFFYGQAYEQSQRAASMVVEAYGLPLAVTSHFLYLTPKNFQQKIEAFGGVLKPKSATRSRNGVAKKTAAKKAV